MASASFDSVSRVGGGKDQGDDNKKKCLHKMIMNGDKFNEVLFTTFAKINIPESESTDKRNPFEW